MPPLLRVFYAGTVSTPRWPLVLFDLDGTVVNTIPLIIASYDYAVYSVLGFHPDPEESRSWIGRTLVDTFGEYYPDEADRLVDAYTTWNIAHLPDLVQTYPGMDDLLAALPRHMVNSGVATSKRRASAERTLALVGLAGLVELVVTMEDTPTHKPDPAPLRLALQRLSGRAEQAVYIGDAAVDVKAARAVGMDAIAVTWGAGTRDELADAGPLEIVGTMDQLRSLLLSKG